MQIQRSFFGDSKCKMENCDFEDPLYDISRRKKVTKTKSKLMFKSKKMKGKFESNIKRYL